MAAARLAALLHHVPISRAVNPSAGVPVVVLLFVKQAGDVRRAKLVGIAAERSELGRRRISPVRIMAVGEARVGRQIGVASAGESHENPFERRQQQDVRCGRLRGRRRRSRGRARISGAYGGQGTVVALPAKQGQALQGAVALQDPRGSPLCWQDPPCLWDDRGARP